MKRLNYNNRKIEVISYYITGMNKEVVLYQQKVFDYFNIPINIKEDIKSHGEFLTNTANYLVKHSDIDIVIFFDIDCIPLSQDAISHLVNKVNDDTICGIEQSCNCNLSPNHIYAGPACLVIPLNILKQIKPLNFQTNSYCDVAQQFTFDCEKNNIKINNLLITKCKKPQWGLGNTGKMFGIGTIYDDIIYHQFCIRDANQQQDFINKCKEVINE